jgi:vacuolar-type H+-ATPase subunit F/Vma7
MDTIVFIGDELSAAGFHLTGIETMVPDDAAAAREALAAARTKAGLVIITAATAQHIPAAELDLALLAPSPIVALVPDILLQTRPPDLAARLRAVLGIEP